MSTPHQLFQDGKLTDSVAAALADVKAAPADRGKRYLLCELLCFAGDLERADKQLDVLGSQPDAADALAVAVFRQLLRAELARREFHDQGRVPEFLGQPSAEVQLHLRAAVALRDANPAEAVRLLGEADADRAKLAGTHAGTAFDDFRDLDDLLSPVLEVLTGNGKYYWVPLAAVEAMEFPAPQRPRDLLWRRCRLQVKDGPDGEVYVPATYHGSHLSPDEAVRLGRRTDWVGGGDGSPCRGLGQREFLVGDDPKAAMELTAVTFS